MFIKNVSLFVITLIFSSGMLLVPKMVFANNFYELSLPHDSEEEVYQVYIVDDLDELSEWSENLILLDEAFTDLSAEETDLSLFLDLIFSEYQILPAKIRALKRSCASVRDGGASWYGPGFHGKKTANGERFNQNDMTAAHKTIPFNSIVEVTYKGRTVRVRINDAGPYVGGRVIDLSKAAAAQLGLIQAGHGQVQLRIIRCGKG